MSDCDFTWPEQDIIDAWVAKHGLQIDRKVLYELKDNMTAYRKSAKYLPTDKLKEKVRFGKQLSLSIKFRSSKLKKPKLTKFNKFRKWSMWHLWRS